MLYLALLIILIFVVVLADRLAPEAVTRVALALERRLSGLRLQQAQVDGFVMPYLEGGRGQPLILIHGFGGDKDNFTRMARHLVGQYRVIIPDLPGFGDAGRDMAAQYTISVQVARLHTFLQQLGLSSIEMGGNSMGGFISAQFAATYPQMVSSVWLINPLGTAASTQSEVLLQYASTGKVPLLVQSEAEFTTLIQKATYKTPFLPYSVRHVLATRAIRDFPLHSIIFKQLIGSPLLEQQYSQLATPALVVTGDRDLILHPNGAEAAAKLFLHSKVIIMPDIGHLPMMEAPGTTAKDYLAFRQR
jgi:triacylglycerol lipase